MGADAVAIGTAALIALGDNHPRLDEELKKIGSAAGFYDDWQNGRDPAGYHHQDPELSKRLDPVEGGRRLANYLRDGAGGTDHGPRLRQVAPAQPRSRGPGGADRGVGGHGPVPLAGTGFRGRGTETNAPAADFADGTPHRW
jgi:hypothetical protein